MRYLPTTYEVRGKVIMFSLVCMGFCLRGARGQVPPASPPPPIRGLAHPCSTPYPHGERVVISWLRVTITRTSWNGFSAIFINLAPIFDDTTCNFVLFFLHHFSCNRRLQLGLSKILMKLMKIVWHCRRLHQFILVDCCDLIPAFRLVKIGQDCQRSQLFQQRLVKIVQDWKIWLKKLSK